VTTQAIAAFEGLAKRLEAMAEARRPWWRIAAVTVASSSSGRSIVGMVSRLGRAAAASSK
jgi:hypothetical protein